MSNLLPETMRHALTGEYRARFILAGSLLATGAAFFTALALSPSYAVLFMTRPAALEQASIAQKNKTDATEVARAQALMTQLAPVAAASSSASTMIMEALNKRSSGIHIETINYVYGKTTSNLSLGGFADSREATDKYRLSLQGDSSFSTVKLPVGDLVNAKGGRFTITLAGHF